MPRTEIVCRFFTRVDLDVASDLQLRASAVREKTKHLWLQLLGNGCVLHV